MKIHCKVNSTAVEVEADADEMLLEVLRRDLNLRSVRVTCGVGICGACTALVNEEPISTCIFLAPLAEGCEITTVEEIKTALGGNLCRCGCYIKIIQAAKRAATYAS